MFNFETEELSHLMKELEKTTIRKINDRSELICSVVEESHISAKSDFEIWGFKGFFL